MRRRGRHLVLHSIDPTAAPCVSRRGHRYSPETGKGTTMRGVFRVGVYVCACALALVMALSARVETQSGFAETLVRTGAATTAAAVITDAPAGFDVASNGFAEEYCARQEHLTNTGSSPGVEDDECSFDDAAAEFGQHDTEA